LQKQKKGVCWQTDAERWVTQTWGELGHGAHAHLEPVKRQTVKRMQV